MAVLLRLYTLIICLNNKYVVLENKRTYHVKNILAQSFCHNCFLKEREKQNGQKKKEYTL